MRDSTLVLALLVAGCSTRVESGFEVVCRLKSPADTEARRRDAAEETAKFLRKRASLLDLNASSWVDAAAKIHLQLPTSDFLQVRSVLSLGGLFDVLAVASVEVQGRFNRDSIVPDGYWLVENPEPGKGVYEAFGARLLVLKQRLVEPGHITDAGPRKELIPGGSRWVTDFELNAEGAWRLDEAAARLYARNPPGLIALMFDGKVKYVVPVQSPSFHGRVRVSSVKSQAEARDLALMLQKGAIPFEIEVESAMPFGPAKK